MESVALRVDYDDADDLVSDYTQNLSGGGACVASSRDVPEGVEVRLSLSFPGLVAPIPLSGVVRWSRDGELGIEFDDESRAQLEDVIAKVRLRDPTVVRRTCRVLVVEDNPHIAQLLRHGLAQDRVKTDILFDVRVAGDGRDALDQMRDKRFDMLIIDVYLPVLDGSGVITAVRTKLGLRDLPIIAVSGGGDPARRAALSAGANLFIEKPMRLKSVLERMREIMNVGAPQ